MELYVYVYMPWLRCPRTHSEEEKKCAARESEREKGERERERRSEKKKSRQRHNEDDRSEGDVRVVLLAAKFDNAVKDVNLYR